MRAKRHRRLPLAAILLAALWLGGAPAALPQVILGLPDETAGEKVAASDRIKSGMASIRKLVIDAHTLITHRRLSPDGARRFASAVDRHIADLRDDPAASALSSVLDDIASGAKQIAAPDSGDGKLDGLDKIETALTRYALLFDDPDWKPLR